MNYTQNKIGIWQEIVNLLRDNIKDFVFGLIDGENNNEKE